jgi:hypothetical protein
MSKRRPVLGFLIRFLLLYTVLMIPWPGVRESYRSAFMAGARTFATLITSGDPVEVIPIDKAKGPEDTALVIQEDHGGSVRIGINSGEVAYFPTALAITLILSTPAPWRRRIRGLLVGLLLINGFIVIRLAVMVWYTHSLLVTQVAAIVTPSPPTFWSKALQNATFAAGIQFVGVGHGLACIIAVLIWTLVMLRGLDFSLLLSETDAKSHQPEES